MSTSHVTSESARRPRTSNRAPRPLGLFFLAFCTLGAPLAAVSAFGCSQAAEASPAATTSPSKAGLWREGNGKPIAGAKNYDPRDSLAPMLQQVVPTVVSIEAHGGQAGITFRGGVPTQVPGGGIGSGFIIGSDGLVVTNAHVVNNFEEFKVHLEDGRVFEAKLVGADPQTDVALIQLEGAKNLPVATLGSSDSMSVGDWVIAVGTPLGLEQSVTRGIVSAKGRGSLGLYADGYADFLQTDAAISPGNSGGPLFNLAGEVVGMNTAVSGMGQNLGFAVPVDQIKQVLRPLHDEGRVTRGWLGIGGQDVTPALGQARDPGAIVGQVHASTPAAKAGLQQGDRIVGVDGKNIRDFDDLRGRIGEHRPGDEIRVALIRDGKPKQLEVKLEERPDPRALSGLSRSMAPGTSPGIQAPPQAPRTKAAPGRSAPESAASGNPPRLGVEVREVEGKVVVERVDPSGRGASLGLRPGDVLEAVNGREVRSAAEVRAALEAKPGQVSVTGRRGAGRFNSTVIGG